MSAIPVQDIVYSVLFAVVLVFNIAGNSLVIYIITNKRGMKTSTNYLLLNLAVADLLFGLFHTPEFIFIPLLGKPSLPDGFYGDWLCRLLLFSNIAALASRVSIFTIICLSVERYFAVCRPHSFSQRFSPKIVKVLVMVSWIYAVVEALPLFVYANWNIEDRFCEMPFTAFLKGHSLFLLTEYALFLILMMFLLTKIFISLWCKQTVEPTGEREITERKKKKKVTLCVVAVVVTFIVCWIPFYVIYTIQNFSRSSRFSPDTTTAALLVSINAALDPYLFSFQSSRFKIIAKKILCCKKPILYAEEREQGEIT